MKIKWLGHAAFLITLDNGTKIVTDPFDPKGYPESLTYPEINEAADIITVSHSHSDHNWAEGIKGDPKVVSTAGEHAINGLKLLGIKSFHDTARGSQRGNNIMFLIEAENLRLLHCGDIGHPLSNETIAQLRPVNVLLLPVGGTYTIDAREASKLMKALSPNISIPMHYQTHQCTFPIEGVDVFLDDKLHVRKIPEASFNASSLPPGPEVWVLEPSQ